MPATSPCVPCCSTSQVTEVPGVEGEAGTDGADGTNAFTTETGGGFVIPGVGANVTVSLVNSTWMAIGQKVVFDGPATFEVVSLPGATSAELMFMGYTDDLSPGASVASGAKVSPSGTQPDLTTLSVVAAGTAAVLTATVGGALLDFGTTDPILTLTSPGTWMLFARVRIDYNNATFASRRTVTIKIRRTNNTPADLVGPDCVPDATDSFSTQIITTQSFIAGTVHIAVKYETNNANDILQIWGDVSVLPGGTSIDAVEASIVAVKIAAA